MLRTCRHDNGYLRCSPAAEGYKFIISCIYHFKNITIKNWNHNIAPTLRQWKKRNTNKIRTFHFPGIVLRRISNVFFYFTYAHFHIDFKLELVLEEANTFYKMFLKTNFPLTRNKLLRK
ncbi:hypothetical protein FWK35_00030689 [Aphis craccivora]|uniref:Uncharacterized protein n=1 Tax=Aphis craccivora TaxID=307492 RepID=A0A6G0YPA5_APHCR|nr:hypothetical protein FWK35_00030689 [Aphis craccivora]